MGGKPSTASINCPRTVEYVDDLKRDRDNLSNRVNSLNNIINDLNYRISIKQNEINSLTNENASLNKQILLMFTKAQLDATILSAIQPLQLQIESNNATISSLKNDINNLTLEKNKLTKQLELERNVIDQSLTIANNEAQKTAFSSANYIYDSNEKTYDYYNAIREQNDKLLSKAKNSKQDNLTYDQKAFYQIERLDFTVKINFILYVIYYVFLIILIGILFFVQKNINIYYRITIIILFLLYPFIIYTIEKILYDAATYTHLTINTNIYSNNY